MLKNTKFDGLYQKLMREEFFCFPSNLWLIFYANYSLFPSFFLFPSLLFLPSSFLTFFLLVHIRFSTHFFYLLICEKTQTDFQSILPFFHPSLELFHLLHIGMKQKMILTFFTNISFASFNHIVRKKFAFF